MAIRTFTRLYDSHDDAVSVVQSLEAAGVPHADISLVSNNAEGRYGNPTTGGSGLTSGDPHQGASTGTGTGASVGTLLGGGAGLLAGLGMLAIPGVGPVVAAGWLIATLTGAGVGAAAGGLVGSLTGAGVSEADAQVHAEGVRRGGTLVTVRADEMQATRIETVLDGRTPVNLATRRSEYQTEGWENFNPSAVPYTADSVMTARRQRGGTLS